MEKYNFWLWDKAQHVTIRGASCHIVEDIEGGFWILAPLAKVAPRKSYEAEDVPNAQSRRKDLDLFLI